jgi:uncharacterized protein (DUF433 family)
MPEPIACLPPDDPRVSRGLFTAAQAASWLTIPSSTFRAWVHGYEQRLPGRCVVSGQPILLSLPARSSDRSSEVAIPFLGLVEGLVLRAFRRAGVPLQRIRPALERLDRELGLKHALASDRLAIHGPEILYDYGARRDPDGIGEVVTVRSGQCVFAPIVCDSLRRIGYGGDHWAERVELPGYAVARVVVDLELAGGRPALEGVRVPVEDVVQRWVDGESMTGLAAAFGLPVAELEDVLRRATRRRDAWP